MKVGEAEVGRGAVGMRCVCRHTARSKTQVPPALPQRADAGGDLPLPLPPSSLF